MFLVTLIIAQINVFSLRPILTLALFGRIIIDKQTQARYTPYLRLPFVKLMVCFLVYGIFVALAQDMYKYDLLKGGIDTVILTYCVYHFYFKSGNADQLKMAMLISGFICFADLAYTYVVFGSFPVQRVYFMLAGNAGSITEDDLDATTNWNFFGQTCGMCFVYVLSDYIKNKSSSKWILWLLPLMFLGVLMSTSRSALLSMLLFSVLIVLNGINFKEQKKRIYKVGRFSVAAVVLGLLLFGILGKYLSLDTKFIDEIVNRLSQEPIAIMKKAMGQSYNIQDLGSMDWREQSAENAYNAYMNMDFKEQLFGIGSRGFEARDLGKGFNAHNAMLLLLIENGIIGFSIFMLMYLGTIIRSILRKNFSPALAVICFTLVYGLGQNREWSSWTSYLFIYCVVAELEFQRINRVSRQQDLMQQVRARALLLK